MSELVCLQCGKELEYDWAPCPHCGWEVPNSWEEPDEEYKVSSRAILAKPRTWIRATTWTILAAALAWVVLWLLRG